MNTNQVSDAAAIDWQAIEAKYRAGSHSTREIAREHHVSHTAIAKRAEKEGWTQDRQPVSMLRRAVNKVTSMMGNAGTGGVAATGAMQQKSNGATRVESQPAAPIAQAEPAAASGQDARQEEVATPTAVDASIVASPSAAYGLDTVAKVSGMVAGNKPEQVAGQVAPLVAGGEHENGAAATADDAGAMTAPDRIPTGASVDRGWYGAQFIPEAPSMTPAVSEVRFVPDIGNRLNVHLDLEGRPMKGVDQDGRTIWRVLRCRSAVATDMAPMETGPRMESKWR